MEARAQDPVIAPTQRLGLPRANVALPGLAFLEALLPPADTAQGQGPGAFCSKDQPAFLLRTQSHFVSAVRMGRGGVGGAC